MLSHLATLLWDNSKPSLFPSWFVNLPRCNFRYFKSVWYNSQEGDHGKSIKIYTHWPRWRNTLSYIISNNWIQILFWISEKINLPIVYNKWNPAKYDDLGQRSVKFFHKEADGKYFSLWGPYGLSCTYSSLLSWHKSCHRHRANKQAWLYFYITLLQYRWWARFRL